MAADWTPMRNDLRDDPAVVSIAMTLGIDHDAVVGKLLAVWGWAGTHTVTGKCNGVTLAHVNHAARCEKFGDAMEAAGWLKRDAEGNVTFPRWNKWNGKAAKSRLQSAVRMARKRWRDKLREQRNKSVNVTMLQNSTEQLKKTPLTPQGGEAVSNPWNKTRRSAG